MKQAHATSTQQSIILFNKPYDVLCQFTDNKQPDGGPQRQTLADFIQQPGYYAAGRLDRDSEGLLVLTNDGKLQNRISDPAHKMAKTYYVQIEGEIDPAGLSLLETGVKLKDGPARATNAACISEPDWLWPRNPPIRERKSIPTSWVSLTIREGRNRQVRRMTAAAGYPTLRLIRVQVGDWTLQGLQPADWRFA